MERIDFICTFAVQLENNASSKRNKVHTWIETH
ncbi:hypothetical protein SAMN04488493_12414, partial [Xylanibacter ruminicola]